ncbi:Integrase [Yersinia intermedia]|nr:Integrase [Yersinia intermedia]CQD77463.1 Integrase [Yersinia intermedia]
MAQRDNLHRRSSGIYVVRIAVPARYRLYAGQREIHASTETNDIRKARAIAAVLLAVWQRYLGQYQKLDKEKLVSSAPALAGEGMSQEAFADRCGFARSYMSRIERGGSNASLDAVEVLANALSVEPWQLLASDSSEDNDPEMLVPYAADGSCFNPGLASTRDGSFGVGDKAAQKRFGTFSEALLIAKWCRPNPSGNWGIVSAVRWDKLRK